MLTKVKMFIIGVEGDVYACLYEYYTDEAKGFVELGRYDEAERCQELATKYLIKEANLMYKALETV